MVSYFSIARCGVEASRGIAELTRTAVSFNRRLEEFLRSSTSPDRYTLRVTLEAPFPKPLADWPIVYVEIGFAPPSTIRRSRL
jgi:hypothetical protein